jgi:hypothetical protein
MKKLILLILIGYGTWNFYLKPSASPVITNIAADGSLLSAPAIKASQPTLLPLRSSIPSRSTSATSSNARCDGRTRCSQMTSCAEAKYFLQNCPGTQMDGEGDGIPCERQWCH